MTSCEITDYPGYTSFTTSGGYLIEQWQEYHEGDVRQGGKFSQVTSTKNEFPALGPVLSLLKDCRALEKKYNDLKDEFYEEKQLQEKKNQGKFTYCETCKNRTVPCDSCRSLYYDNTLTDLRKS